MSSAAHRLPAVERWHGADDTLLTPESHHVMPSGQRMPLLGLGTWQLRAHPVDAIAHAFELGFRMVDTSGDYHTQQPIGAALRANSVVRSSIYLVTKIEECDDAFAAARRHVADLGVDHVDLLLIHRPPPHGVGERLWEGLRRAKRAGLTRDIGVSNYSIHHIEELVYRTGEMPAVNQIEWTPFGHSPSMLDFCRDNGILIQAWSPLTRGQRLNDDKLASMAARYGKTPAQILVRWNLQSGVVPIPKSAEPRHQQDLLNVFDFEIAGTDMLRLNAMNEYYSALGRLLYV
jgi:diketogulonate reductase-like aldo/keto reductase